jgi:hypothetical protein
VHQCHGAQGIVDTALAVGERVVDGEDETGGELPQRTPGIHEGGRVRHEQPLGHKAEKVLRDLIDCRIGCPVAPIRSCDSASHPLEQVPWCFYWRPRFVLDQVPLFKDGDGIGRQPDCVPWGGRFHRTPRLKRY